MKLLCLATLVWTTYAAPFSDGDSAMLQAGYFQGDIAEFDPFEFTDRAAVANPNQLWPRGVLYYKIDSSLEFLRSDLMNAMREFEMKTCVKFREATANTKDYVNIAYMSGCWSRLGRKGGKQDLSLGDGCHHKGTIMHELAHALGFIHEQSRSDRDDYLEILWHNIEEGQAPQFIKMKYYDNNLLGEKFDYKSIMLYDETTFSKDGVSPTIRVKEPGVVIGKVFLKNFLSESDVNRVNKLYECFGMVRPTPPEAPDQFCDLEEDDCGIKNEFGSTSFVRRRVTLGGRTSTVYIVEAQTAKESLVGIRTPIYQLYGKKEGCFSFDYYVDGKGIYYFNAWKNANRLFEAKDKSQQWRTYQVSVMESDGDVTFSIGGSMFSNKAHPGTFAIDNINFTRSPCKT